MSYFRQNFLERDDKRGKGVGLISEEGSLAPLKFVSSKQILPETVPRAMSFLGIASIRVGKHCGQQSQANFFFIVTR
jgi:hypothetical protein